MSTQADKEWLTVEELAAWLDVPVKTVYWLNTTGQAPRRHKIGKQVRYRRSDVESWLETRVV